MDLSDLRITSGKAFRWVAIDSADSPSCWVFIKSLMLWWCGRIKLPRCWFKVIGVKFRLARFAGRQLSRKRPVSHVFFSLSLASMARANSMLLDHPSRYSLPISSSVSPTHVRCGGVVATFKRCAEQGLSQRLWHGSFAIGQ